MKVTIFEHNIKRLEETGKGLPKDLFVNALLDKYYDMDVIQYHRNSVFELGYCQKIVCDDCPENIIRMGKKYLMNKRVK